MQPTWILEPDFPFERQHLSIHNLSNVSQLAVLVIPVWWTTLTSG